MLFKYLDFNIGFSCGQSVFNFQIKFIAKKNENLITKIYNSA